MCVLGYVFNGVIAWILELVVNSGWSRKAMAQRELDVLSLSISPQGKGRTSTVRGVCSYWRPCPFWLAAGYWWGENNWVPALCIDVTNTLPSSSFLSVFAGGLDHDTPCIRIMKTHCKLINGLTGIRVQLKNPTKWSLLAYRFVFLCFSPTFTQYSSYFW